MNINKRTFITNMKVDTKNSMNYTFYPVSGDSICFKVKAPNDAHVALTGEPSPKNPIYEIFFGGWENTRISIRRNMEKPNVREYISVDNILDKNNETAFYINFARKNIQVGYEENENPILSWPDPNLFKITHFGIRTCWGADGSWIITERITDKPNYTFDQETLGTGDGTWVGANSRDIPPNAICGGTDKFGKVYVGRALHLGLLLPGKIVPKLGFCYVSWNEKEFKYSEYEVLCDCRGKWMSTSQGNIPPNAVPGGKNDDGKTLYIGRAVHNNYVTPGRVEKDKGTYYSSFEGVEITSTNYEILVLD